MTKYQLEKENKALVKEARGFRRRIKFLEEKLKKYKGNTPDLTPRVSSLEILVRSKSERITELMMERTRNTKRSIDLNKRLKDFAELPWYQRMLFNSDDIKELLR